MMLLWRILQEIIRYIMKHKVILIGSGQHCNVVLYNLKEQNIYDVACIAEIDISKCGKNVDGIPIEHFTNFSKDAMDRLEKKYNTNMFFISFGSMKYRKPVYDFLITNGWKSVNIIHPNAVVSPSAHLGNGILIECGCLVTPSPIIGNNVVINTGSQVNHDNIIEDHVYIASGVVLSGGVKIGANTLLDDGVIVSLGKSVGENCVVGAGGIVTKNIPNNSVAYGNPCRVIRENRW